MVLDVIVILSTRMSGRPYLEEVLELVRLFLVKGGHDDLAEQLQERYELPAWVREDNPLLKKGLTKIIKDFISNNHKVQHYFENRQEPQAVSTPLGSPRMQLRSDDKPAKKEEGKSSAWMSMFDQPKRLEDIVDSQTNIQAEKEHPKTGKHKKATKKAPVIESSDYESEEDSFELDPPPQPKKKVKKEVKEEKKKEKEEIVKSVKEPRKP